MVRDFRYLKVRERQINKFNRLLQKEVNIQREGNIIWLNNPPILSQGVAQAQAQVALTHSQEGVQAVVNARQARVSAPVAVPKSLQWEMSLLSQTMHQVSMGNKGQDPEAQGRHPGFHLSWDPITFNLGLLGVHPPLRGKTT